MVRFIFMWMEHRQEKKAGYKASIMPPCRCIPTRWWQDRSTAPGPVPACPEPANLALSTSGMSLIMKILETQGPLSRHISQHWLFSTHSAYQSPQMLISSLCCNEEVGQTHNVCLSHYSTDETHSLTVLNPFISAHFGQLKRCIIGIVLLWL